MRCLVQPVVLLLVLQLQVIDTAAKLSSLDTTVVASSFTSLKTFALKRWRSLTAEPQRGAPLLGVRVVYKYSSAKGWSTNQGWDNSTLLILGFLAFIILPFPVSFPLPPLHGRKSLLLLRSISLPTQEKQVLIDFTTPCPPWCLYV